MGWNKREPASNLVILGDDEGNVASVSGLLVAVTQDTMYPNRMNYELVQRSGDSLHLAGSASLGRQIGPHDVGKFVKCAFAGWGKSANGKFKQIEVNVWEGDPTEAMKSWPRYGEPHKPAAHATPAAKHPKAEPFADIPVALADEEDSSLPF